MMLLLLGELGRVSDLSAFPEVEQFIVRALSEGREDVKATASLALGGVAVGNVSQHLPLLLSRIAQLDSTSSKQLYLLLKSLNEVLRTLLFRSTPMPQGEHHNAHHAPCTCCCPQWRLKLPLCTPPCAAAALCVGMCSIFMLSDPTGSTEPCVVQAAQWWSRWDAVQGSRIKCCSCCISACMCPMSAARWCQTALRS